jgi:threonine dehydrogenase-like Zn-dependent dehydrogenase
MREAVTIGPGHIELRDIPEPAAPGTGEALLEIAAVGLCGSDLELFRGTDPYSHFPARQGHEYSARVLGLGPGSSGRVKVGDLVAVEPLLPDGTCIACRRGHPNCCVNLRVTGGQIDGAFVELFTMPADNLYPANDLSPAEAAFVEPVSIGMQMVTRSGVQSGDQAVIFGAGPIGQSVLLAARDRGARVLVVDRLVARLEVARALGAEQTVPANAAVRDTVANWTNGDGPVVVFEATGSPVVLRTALEVVAHSGTLVIAGTPTEEVSIPPFLIVYKELNVLGSRNNSGVFGQALEVVRRNRLQVGRLITHTFPLDQVADAIEFAIANPQTVEKVMIAVSDEARQAAGLQTTGTRAG